MRGRGRPRKVRDWWIPLPNTEVEPVVLVDILPDANTMHDGFQALFVTRDSRLTATQTV